MSAADDRSAGGRSSAGGTGNAGGRGSPGGTGSTRGTGARARAVLGALSLLVLGAVIGIAVDRHFVSRGSHSPAAALHEMTMSSLDDRLDLTADQRRQIDSIVAGRHDALRHAWQMVHSQLGAAVDTVHQEIEAVLTPGQRSAFREWLRDTGPGPAR